MENKKPVKFLKRDWQTFKEEILQVRVLTKLFLKRFIQKDNLDLDDKNTEFLVFAVVFVSLWGGYLASNTSTLFFYQYHDEYHRYILPAELGQVATGPTGFSQPVQLTPAA